jgi:hypothetical protein
MTNVVNGINARVHDGGIIVSEADNGNTLVIMKLSGYVAWVNQFIIWNQTSQIPRDASMADQFQKEVRDNA